MSHSQLHCVISNTTSMIVNWAWWQRRKILVCCSQTISSFLVMDSCKRANRMLDMINWIIASKCTETLLSLYKTMVQPLVEYSSPVWSPYIKTERELLERIQHRFTRMIPGLTRIPFKERPSRLKLWSLEERRNRSDLIPVFKSSFYLNIIDFLKLF